MGSFFRDTRVPTESHWLTSIWEKMWEGGEGRKGDKKHLAVPDKVKKMLKEEDFVDKEWDKSQFVKGAYKYKDIMSVYKYHKDDEVERILVAQSDRIAEALGDVEQSLTELDFTYEGSKIQAKKYQPQGLKEKWNAWMKKHTDTSNKKLENFFELNDEYDKALNRLKGNKGKLNPKKSDHKTVKEKYETLIDTLKNAKDEYRKMKNDPLGNPFKNRGNDGKGGNGKGNDGKDGNGKGNDGKDGKGKSKDGNKNGTKKGKTVNDDNQDGNA